MRTAESIEGYVPLLSAEYRSEVRAEEYVRWAQDMLEQGFDSPALLRLAIEEPPLFTPDLERLFDSAVSELEIEPMTGEQALIAHGQRVAARLLNDDITATEAARRIAQLFDFRLAPAGLTHWIYLEEAETCEYCAARFATDRSLDEAILDEAKKLLAIDWRKR